MLSLKGSSQSNSNPFEIISRLPKTSLSSAVNTNPFEMVAHRVPGASKQLTENSTLSVSNFSVLPRGGGMNEGLLLVVLLAVFGLLTFSVASNRSLVGKAWRGFLSDNALNLAQRDASGMVGSAPYYFLYVNFLLNAGIFIFLVTRTFLGDTFNNLIFLLICMVGAIMAFLSKHVFVNLVSYLFSRDQEARRYNFLIMIFNCVLGLFLVPFNFLITFSEKADYKYLLVFWMLGVVTIFYLYRGLRSARIGIKNLGSSPFHFLLYLCAVEIAPVLLLVKLAIMQKP
ncbi:MAG: DUF4271 domain-containing protein [Lewinellaceae bacterium]|nr:DUF4271 domain-containing protein [Saprospiraceae bacterium]MCB9345026.1 DUF4271 domain-containing protein [Lewinellaceae bacterium]